MQDGKLYIYYLSRASGQCPVFISSLFWHNFRLTEKWQVWRIPIFPSSVLRAKSLRSCLTLCNQMDPMSPTRLLCPWDSPGKNTGMSCHALLPLGDLPNPGIEPVSLISPALADGFFTTSTIWEAHSLSLDFPIFSHPIMSTSAFPIC